MSITFHESNESGWSGWNDMYSVHDLRLHFNSKKTITNIYNKQCSIVINHENKNGFGFGFYDSMIKYGGIYYIFGDVFCEDG